MCQYEQKVKCEYHESFFIFFIGYSNESKEESHSTKRQFGPNSLFNVSQISSTIWDGFQRLTQSPSSSSEVTLPQDDSKESLTHENFSEKTLIENSQSTTEHISDAKKESKSSGIDF